MRARHLLVPLFMFAPIVGCSGDDIVDSLTGPTGLDVRGTYQINGLFEVRDLDTNVAAGSYACGGLVSVTTQVGNQFSGTWTITAGGDCPGEFVGTMSGSIDGNTDDVTASFLIPGRDAAVEAITGCIITSGDDEFDGYIDPDTGDVFLQSVYTANCPSDAGMTSYRFDIVFED
jgi:hypothetical protein